MVCNLDEIDSKFRKKNLLFSFLVISPRFLPLASWEVQEKPRSHEATSLSLSNSTL